TARIPIGRITEADEINGAAVFLTSDEGLLLSLDERQRVVETACDAAGGRVPVVAHVGCMTTADSIRLARWATAEAHPAGLEGLLRTMGFIGPEPTPSAHALRLSTACTPGQQSAPSASVPLTFGKVQPCTRFRTPPGPPSPPPSSTETSTRYMAGLRAI